MNAGSSNYRDFADQVRNAADIVEVVGQYVELKRAGANMKGLCPFHSEKTPSFNVHPGKQIFKCFGCGKGGDAISFVREIERVGYQEALKILADKYHLEMPSFRAKGPGEEEIRWRQTLSEVVEKAAGYYQKRLADPQAGAFGRQYLAERGMTQEMIQTFRVGIIGEEWDGLEKYLTSQGYSEKAMLETGLVHLKKSGRGTYDYLRERLIFPIANARGHTIAFGGRVLKKDGGPKYMNTPETPLFHKSRELYGLSQSRETMTREGQPAVLVEGYMDVIACHQAGIRSAVASMGTSLTPEQARLVRRYSSEAVFLYDADEAGIKAILRGLDILVGAGLAVRVGLMPAGEDPDSYAQANGAEALQVVVRDAVPFFDFMLDQASKRYNLQMPEESVGALELFEPVLSAINEPLVQDGYIRKLAVALGHEEGTLRQFLARQAKRRRPVREAVTPAPVVTPAPPVDDDRPPEMAPPPDLHNEDGPFALSQEMRDAHYEEAPAEVESDIPIGAQEPTSREKGLLRILMEHADARSVAREKFHPQWVPNPLVRYWVARLLELGDEAVDAWPRLMEMCENRPEQRAFLELIIFETSEPLDVEYIAILEHLMAVMGSDFRKEENRRLNLQIARLAEKKDYAAIAELYEQLKQNLNQRVRERKEATTENAAMRMQY